ERFDRYLQRRSEKICVVREINTLWDRGIHIDPFGRPAVGPQPGLFHSDRDQAAGARSQTKSAVIQDQHWLAFEHIKTLLERLQMLIHMALRVELAYAPARMD